MRQNIFSSRKGHGCSMVPALCGICMNVVCAYGMDKDPYVCDSSMMDAYCGVCVSGKLGSYLCP